MLRVGNTAERSVFADPPAPVTVAAATATILLRDEQNYRTGEISERTIQNVGANDLYYAFNTLDRTKVPPAAVCDNVTNFHGLLKPGLQLACNHRQSVCGYSVNGTVVAVTILRRVE